MVTIYRASKENEIRKKGYFADYVADVKLLRQVDTAGVIIVSIPEGQTSPHFHRELEELFIACTPVDIYIDEKKYLLEKGDVVLVAPGEHHYFVSPPGHTSWIIAIKLPNLKDDKGC